MAQAFGVSLNKTSGSASTTTPWISCHSTANVYPKVYEMNFGSDATADNAISWNVQRLSTSGTSLATITPGNLYANDGAAGTTAISVWNTTYNIQPTVTATVLLTWGQHQRGTYRWVAYDYTKMISPATGTANGLGWLVQAVTAAFNVDASVAFEE